MLRTLAGLIIVLSGFVVAAASLEAQAQWQPPSAEMPAMPRMADLQGTWLNSAAPWFSGIEGVAPGSVARLRTNGEANPASDRAQVIRVLNGPIPVAVWSDRNGDGIADMVEIFRGGRLAFQLIDADYNGRANVMRVYDAAGALLREERLRR